VVERNTELIFSHVVHVVHAFTLTNAMK
jgi:hypothetical protein